MARGRASRTHHSLGNTERRKIEICEHSVAVHPQHKALAGVLRVGLEQVAKDHDLGPSRVAVARMAVPAHDLPGRQDRRRQGAGHGLAHAAAPACARPPARARRTRPPHAPETHLQAVPVALGIGPVDFCGAQHARVAPQVSVATRARRQHAPRHNNHAGERARTWRRPAAAAPKPPCCAAPDRCVTMTSEPGGSCSPTAGPAGPAAPESRATSRTSATASRSRAVPIPAEWRELRKHIKKTKRGLVFFDEIGLAKRT